MEKGYVILGIHGADVEAVVGNVARIRLYVKGKEYDEDFNLPELPPAVPATQEVYEFFLKEAILKRIEELKNAK